MASTRRINLLYRSSLWTEAVPPLTRLLSTTTAKLLDARNNIDAMKACSPFQSVGPVTPFDSKMTSTGDLYMRVDMPYVRASGVKVWVEKDKLFFKGEGGKESKHDDCGRSYGGSIDLLPKSSYFKTDQIVREVKDGGAPVVCTA